MPSINGDLKKMTHFELAQFTWRHLKNPLNFQTYVPDKCARHDITLAQPPPTRNLHFKILMQ
jgi:hypothetical protein